MTDRLEPRSVLVVGAAAGIGAEVTKAFLSEGCRVFAVDVVPVATWQRWGLPPASDRVRFIQADATDERAVEEVFRQHGSSGYTLDVAVNVVGANHSALDLVEDGWDSMRKTLDVTLCSVLLNMKFEIDLMRKQGSGVIINMSSLAGTAVNLGSSGAYSAAKAGVAHLTRWAAVEYGPDGIRVNAIAPGMTLTESVMRNVAPERIARVVSEFQALGGSPIQPSEIAEAAVWLASPAARMVTGHVLPVDGGWGAR